MAHYEFTTQAERDLEGIIDYTLTQWGQAQAEKYIDGLEKLARELANHPDIGTGRDSLFDGLRCFPYTSHVLYYIKQSHGITIIRVLHKHMTPERHIESKPVGTE